MATSWPVDYSWQYGHDADEVDYELRGTITPASAAQQGFRVLRHGATGVSCSLDGDTVVLVSTGEDACEALAAASQELVDALEEISPAIRVAWQTQPPRSQLDGRPAQKVDGYWILADQLEAYPTVREAAVRAVEQAAASLADEVRLEEVDGFTMLVGRRHGQVRFRLYLGMPQVQMVREEQAAGTLPQFVASLV